MSVSSPVSAAANSGLSSWHTAASSPSLSVVNSLRGRSVFITGATGFVGKVVVEKLIRSCPDLAHIYVLVRPRRGSTADERLHSEIISSPIFTRLRSELGSDAAFDNLMNSKLVAVAGEMTQHDIGLSPQDYKLLSERVHVIIHCAAIVDFNERIDRAVELNVMGSLRVLDLAKKCKQLVAMIHVSTCYVNSNRRGWVDENLYPLGFDVDEMLKKVKSLSEAEMGKVSIGTLLGEWPNTYTFTKAMTEKLLFERRGHVPIAIVRPSIIGASWKEPVPGWVDVISAAGAVYTAAGLGILKFLPGRAENIADVVPVDYVVNTILVAIPALEAKPDEMLILQSATSSERPMYWGHAIDVVLRYSRLHPLPRAVGYPSFFFVDSPQAYQLQFFFKYSIPSSILMTMAALPLAGMNSQTRIQAQQFNKVLFRVRILIESFRHFTENEWQFNNRTTRALFAKLNDDDKKNFNLSLNDMDWLNYNWNFMYGILKYVFKEDVIPIESPMRLYDSLNESSWSPDRESPALMSRARSLLFYDVHWLRSTMSSRPHYAPPRPVQTMKHLLLTHPIVAAAIKAESAQLKVPVARVEARARSIVEVMLGDASMSVIASLGWAFRKLWRRIYDGIRVESSGVRRVREMAATGMPIIYLPTHRSYIDFLIVSYIAMACHLPIPFIAAGEDFLGMALIRWLFRHSGAFFIRRSFLGDTLYAQILSTYVHQLLQDGHSIEFFIEGTRSRSGKMLLPKTGLLSVITDAYLDKKIKDALLVPITIDYEKTMEADLYSDELLGEAKIKESLNALLNSTSVLNINFGDIYVNFGEPIALSTYLAESLARTPHIPDQRQPSQPILVQHGSAAAKEALKPLGTLPTLTTNQISPSSSPSSSSPSSPLSSPSTSTSSSTSPSTSAPTASSSLSTSASSASAPLERYDPIQNVSHRRFLNRNLASDIVLALVNNTEALPTHVVASLLLMFRQGITRSQLMEKCNWVRRRVLERGGRLAGFETAYMEQVVDRAIRMLGNCVTQRRLHFYEPNISARQNYKNMLGLGHYRNKLLHLFFREGMFACAMYSLHERSSANSSPSFNTDPSSSSSSSSSFSASLTSHIHISKSSLLSEVAFLHALLSREFVVGSESYSSNSPLYSMSGQAGQAHARDHMTTLASMIQRGTLREVNDDGTHIEVAATGETHFSFLCALFWPFIDSYYVSTMILVSLQPNRIIDENVLLQRTQWLATTLYHESMLSFFESCSLDTLRNAFQLLHHWGVLSIQTTVINPNMKDQESATANSSSGSHVAPPQQKVVVKVSLTPEYRTGPKLGDLINRIGQLRKQPPVKRDTQNRNLIADIPILAKL